MQGGTQREPQGSDIAAQQINGTALFNEQGRGVYKLNLSFKETPSGDGFNLLNYNVPGTAQVFDNKYLKGRTNYSISNFSIVRTLDSEVSNVPIVQQKFTVAFNIDNTDDSPFSDLNTKVKIGIENIPNSWDKKEGDYIQTFLSDSVLSVLGDAPSTGTATGDASSITNYTATYIDATSISISFDVEFNAGAITYINASSAPFFTIYAQTQNHTLDYTNSDRVTLDVFTGVGIQSILLPPATVNNTQFITAPYSDFANGISASDIDGFPVQLLTGSTQFSLDWTNRPNLRLGRVQQKLVLKNTSTLEELELDTTTIPINTFRLIDNEYPEANYSVLKGFKIPNEEVRNKIEMSNISDVSKVRTFEVLFPFFIRWEYYTRLIINNIPSSVIATQDPFQGFNYDVHRIDSLADWELNYRITIKSNESGSFFSQDFDYVVPTTTYNEHPDVLSRSIDSFEEDGVNSLDIGGEKFIDSDSKTLIVAEWLMNYTPSDVSEFEIELYIEAFENGSPTKIQRISSVNNLLSSSWFSSLNGDGLVEKSIDGDKCVAKAYIDNSKLVNYESYTIYGTYYNPKKPTEFLLVENGDNFITEDGNKLIKDF